MEKNLFTKKEIIPQDKGEIDWKFEIETKRYKQDCRKRALEMASGEYIEWYRSLSNPNLPETNKGNPPNITELSDKYYNWLISIPQ